MKAVSLLLISLLLSGCAATHGYATIVAEKAATAADIALADLEYLMCDGITVGAFDRRYGRDQGKVAAWRKLCTKDVGEAPSKSR